MKKICNIHQVGLYLDVPNLKREKQLQKRIEEEMDGFCEYFCESNEEQKMVIHDIYDLNIKNGSIVVPQNANYTPERIFVSLEAKVAFQFTEKSMNFWVGKRTWYIPYMLKYLFEMKGATFIHGAGVALNKKEGILLVAFGGIGKTCFIANAAKRPDVTLLGDDLVILREDGNLLSYPRRFCLYQYHKKLFPDYFKKNKVHIIKVQRNSYITRIVDKLLECIRLPKTFCNYVPVSPIHLFPKEKVEIDAVPLKKVYVLKRIKGIDNIDIQEADDLQKVVSFTHDVILHEWSVGARLEYNYLAHAERNYCDFVNRQRKIIEDCLCFAEKIYYVNIPEKMSAEEVSVKLGTELL